ncbi:MAG: M23 family metallopeptidase [Devosia nanyangense]|uniref:M23 family metallopeptidase n=1 Tax=Devosia nanyangense TaxID=1228055 RepID=A0A933NX04_9HYPH|nr:M23 family metallopeptidase [Devosia nanyangense]
MSIRVAGQALKVAALTSLLLASVSLAGCSSLGLGSGDVTGSVAPSASASGPQTMPQTLKPVSQQVAVGPFIPPEGIGGSGGLVTGSAPIGSVSTSTLPPLTGNETMSAQPSFAPSAKTASLGSTSTPVPPSLAVVPENAYVHVIESGESLYTIARRYDVTAQAIVQANGFSSPDKIFVGQKIIIPGRADLLAAKGPATTKVASIAPVESPAAALVPTKTSAITDAKLVDPNTSTTPVAADPAPAKVAAIEPVMSGADKFRWPVSGKVITDFITSKGTGINIDAPEGSAVRAAENGQVIYVGSGVEGYGVLVLIRHPNGYVSAYAHLKSAGVSKGDNVSRGDNIGLVGMTGSVSRPQLHFELRKGATPVDPIPLLAG